MMVGCPLGRVYHLTLPDDQVTQLDARSTFSSMISAWVLLIVEFTVVLCLG